VPSRPLDRVGLPETRSDFPMNGLTLPAYNWEASKKGEGKECSSCKFVAGKHEYDADEWKKEAGVRRCRACVEIKDRQKALDVAKLVAHASISGFDKSRGFAMSWDRQEHQNDECPICQSEVAKSREIIVKLPCGHVACERCLKEIADRDDYALNLRNCKCHLCQVNFNNERIFYPNAKCFDEEPSEAQQPQERPDDECGGQSSAGAGGKGGMQVPSDEQPDHPIGVGDYVRIKLEHPRGGTSVSDQDPWTRIQRNFNGDTGLVDQWDPEIGRYIVILDIPLAERSNEGTSIQIHSIGVLPEDLVRCASPPIFCLAPRVPVKQSS